MNADQIVSVNMTARRLCGHNQRTSKTIITVLFDEDLTASYCDLCESIKTDSVVIRHTGAPQSPRSIVFFIENEKAPSCACTGSCKRLHCFYRVYEVYETRWTEDELVKLLINSSLGTATYVGKIFNLRRLRNGLLIVCLLFG